MEGGRGETAGEDAKASATSWRQHHRSPLLPGKEETNLGLDKHTSAVLCTHTICRMCLCVPSSSLLY